MELVTIMNMPWAGSYYRAFAPYYELGKDPRFSVTLTNHGDAESIETCSVLSVTNNDHPEAYKHTTALRERIGFGFIYEFDDHFKALPGFNCYYDYVVSRGADVAEKYIRSADACTVTTPFLAEYYSRWNPNVFVCPNAIPDEEFLRSRPERIDCALKRDGEVRIGYAAASNGHWFDFLYVWPVLAALMQEDSRIKLVFVGCDYLEFVPKYYRARVEYAGETNVASKETGQWSVPAWFDLVKTSDMDIQIAPLELTEFNAGKSYLKVMEAGVEGVPIIATGAYEYARYHGEAASEPILLARHLDEWYCGIKSLIANKDERTRLAESNLAYVQERHLMSKVVSSWEAAVLFAADKSRRRAA